MTEQVVQARRGFEVTVEGLGPIFFHGWRSTHGSVRVAAIAKPVSRALIEARGTIDGSYRSAAAILRPGDRFDRETGKRIALARLVEALVPLTSRYPMDDAKATKKALRIEQARLKALRSSLFREIWKRTHKGALPQPRKSNYPFYISQLPRTLNWFYGRYPATPLSIDTECAKGLTPPLAAPSTSEKA